MFKTCITPWKKLPRTDGVFVSFYFMKKATIAVAFFIRTIFYSIYLSIKYNDEAPPNGC